MTTRPVSNQLRWLGIAALLLGVAASAPAPVNPQTIHFDAIPNQIFGGSPFPIAVEASSGLPVSIVSTTPSVCKTVSVLVTLLSAGMCTITASQGGNASYNPAPLARQSFTVSLAAPAGTLQLAPGSPFTVGNSPKAVTPGDFNGDGIPDLAVANAGDNTVAVLLGNGLGGFAPAPGSPVQVGEAPYSIAVGDFNGDGFQDLAVANYGDGTVTVLLGNGSGGFAPSPASPFPVGELPYTVAVGDFNGDGIQDLAISGYYGTMAVLLGNGTGGFTAAPGSPISAGSTLGSVVVADFNRDGIQDLAAVDYSNEAVVVLLGNGSGGFAPAPNSPFHTGAIADSLAVGDFNGDGNPDLVVAISGLSNLAILLGDGKGGFTPGPGSPFPVASIPLTVAVGDFNGDGIPDLITANAASSLSVLLGNGSGGFTLPAGGPISVSSGCGFLAIADFNGDGREDVATIVYTGNTVTAFLGAKIPTSSTLSTTTPLTITRDQTVSLSMALSETGTVFAAPTGTVTFFDGAAVLATATQTSSPYTFSTTGLAAGSHSLTATYNGDIRSQSSTTNTIVIQVNQGSSLQPPAGFEGFPDSTLLSNQYAGGTFGDAIVLSKGITLNEFEFPAHSGSNVASDNTGAMTISFFAPIQKFSGYFTYGVPLTIQAYNSANNLVTSVTSPNSDDEALSGVSGSQANQLLQVSSSAGISKLVITGSAGGTSFTVDDIALTALNKCDLNVDGLVNVLDLQAMVNEIFGGSTPANDLNSDGIANAVDLQVVINAVLQLGCSAK